MQNLSKTKKARRKFFYKKYDIMFLETDSNIRITRVLREI